jgi:5-methylcytosine-specific restriction enzyme A
MAGVAGNRTSDHLEQYEGFAQMTIRETLKPRENLRVIDLVEAAGIDVRDWAISKRGRVRVPASNPAYCYEWSFVELNRFVILNVWHSAIEERNGKTWCDLNLRAYAEEVKQTRELSPSVRGSIAKRATRMDNAMALAFREKLPVRVIIGDGARRNISDPTVSVASRMKRRLLDSEEWWVQRYNYGTGECRLTRGAAQQFIDQFAARGTSKPDKYQVNGEVYIRDRKVRERVLARTNGRCEFCGAKGFRTTEGIYLETHHVIALAKGGRDHESNVVAICANDHREAHHGVRREIIKKKLLAKLAVMYTV